MLAETSVSRGNALTQSWCTGTLAGYARVNARSDSVNATVDYTTAWAHVAYTGYVLIDGTWVPQATCAEHASRRGAA
jgi:hypothetical protein